MKIESVRIQNLRSMKDETILLNDYTCLVGPNGAGKSTVICALNIFFRQIADCATDLTTLDKEDFHEKQTDDPVVVTVTFTHLGEEAQKDFSHYYRQGKLIFSAVATFDESTGKAEVKQHGQRLGLPAFRPFFEAEKRGDKASDLKNTYAGLREEYPDLPAAATKDAMKTALWEYEAAHSGQCKEILSEDNLYGQPGRAANLLEKYVQWLYVPAVKDASSEDTDARNSPLDRLLERTVRAKVDFTGQIDAFRDEWRAEYQELLLSHQEVLHDLSQSLAKRIQAWAHPGTGIKLQWAEDPGKSVRVDNPIAEALAVETGFEGRLARFGHGLQRCYLFALLEELSGHDLQDGRTLMLACEEPELYQHPPQAQHLSGVLQNLTRTNAQVIVSTHSPHFVSGRGFEDVRLVRKVDGQSRVSMTTYDEISDVLAPVTDKQPIPSAGVRAKIHQALQPELNEMFFTPHLVLVEGLEDLAYITAYLTRMGLWDEYRRLGCHMVPTAGKTRMVHPRAVARCLEIPTYTIFDADGHESRPAPRKQHEQSNNALLYLCGALDVDAFPPDPVSRANLTVWPTEIARIVKADVGEGHWDTCVAEVDEEYSHVGGLQKNILHIADVLDRLWDKGRVSDSLTTLCEKLVEFGNVT